METLDQDGQNLVLSYLPLAQEAATSIYKRLSGRRLANVEREDLISEAVLGLCLAAARNRPELQTFRTYAWAWMIGQVRGYLRQLDPLTREHRDQVHRGEATAPEHIGLDAAGPSIDLPCEDPEFRRALCRVDLQKMIAKLRNPRRRYVLQERLRGRRPEDIAEDLGLKRIRERVDAIMRDAVRDLCRDQGRKLESRKLAIGQW
jgi:RNA polymerase sigma factor (sigma-70 family)